MYTCRRPRVQLYPCCHICPKYALALLSLRTRELDCYDYANSTNPPVLHRKETFLPADHPLHARFAKLTRQEEKHGLLDDTATIGTAEGWQCRLKERGFAVRGHRLVRRRDHEGEERTESRNHEI